MVFMCISSELRNMVLLFWASNNVIKVYDQAIWINSHMRKKINYNRIFIFP